MMSSGKAMAMLILSPVLKKKERVEVETRHAIYVCVLQGGDDRGSSNTQIPICPFHAFTHSKDELGTTFW